MFCEALVIQWFSKMAREGHLVSSKHSFFVKERGKMSRMKCIAQSRKRGRDGADGEPPIQQKPRLNGVFPSCELMMLEVQQRAAACLSDSTITSHSSAPDDTVEPWTGRDRADTPGP
jgi:hypothetical protein